MEREISLREINNQAQRPADGHREWYAPWNIRRVREALAHQWGNILIMGCGYGREAFDCTLELGSKDYDYGWFDHKVVGVDIEVNTVRAGTKKVFEGVFDPSLVASNPDYSDFALSTEPIFLHGDITKKETAEVLFEHGYAPFAVATCVGVIDNLLTEEEVQSAFSFTHQVLSPGGYLIVADFSPVSLYTLWWPPEERDKLWWEKRYLHDEKALRLYGVQKNAYGTIIIRPRGIHKNDQLGLSPEETVQAIKEGDFEKLVKHWSLWKIIQELEKTGFKSVNVWSKLTCWDPNKLVFERNTLGEEDFLLGYQIMAERLK
ncbi:MAG: class I SAM-dependent methyltransferase [Patescibacteria group bacterium]|nr:class I SAM-dependent methyltransferase [Patescibacteria group bacterium]